MVSNFAFLHEKFPELEELGMLAERYLRSDPQSCLMKAGLLCEGMIRVMFALDDITLPEHCDAVERIDILQRREALPADVAAAFHLMRRVRNKAAHEGLRLPEAKILYFLQITHSLCEWFFQTYGDESYRQLDFVAPQDAEASGPSPSESKEEAGHENALTEQAVSRAAQASAVPEDIRRKRAVVAASKRHVSEAETRYLIDEQLRKVGWEADSETLRHSFGTRPQVGRNLAIAEWPTDSSVGNRGFADYALFAGTRLVGIIEAKASHKDIPSVLDHQCKDYARHIRKEHLAHTIGEWRGFRVPFLFAANGRPYIRQYEEKSGIWFQDVRNASTAPQALHGWMSPTGLEELLERDIAQGNQRLEVMSADFLTDRTGLNLREYQLRAIEAAERAVKSGAQTVLLAMATGTGKTRTVLGMMYRFLKSGRFRRILFLVDRNALGTQALDVFKDVKLEELHPLNDIYAINGLTDKAIDKETRVHVATVQGMVKRILYSEGSESMPSVTDYDLIIVDEAHRGYILDREMTGDEQLYRDQRDYQSKYREVIDYFQAVKIALTATPALQTSQIFGSPVFSYSYREAVIDGFLVDHDAPHQLSTTLSEQGIHYKPGDTVAVYDPLTGEVTNSELLEDELDFGVDDFNKTVINENFNREILREIAKDIDPEDTSSGKTLIYAVNDHHADMIVRILKEIGFQQPQAFVHRNGLQKPVDQTSVCPAGSAVGCQHLHTPIGHGRVCVHDPSRQFDELASMPHQQDSFCAFFHSHINGVSNEIAAFYSLSKPNLQMIPQKCFPVVPRRHHQTAMSCQHFLPQFQADGFQKRCFTHGLHHAAGSQDGDSPQDTKLAVKGTPGHPQGPRYADFNPQHPPVPVSGTDILHLSENHLARHGVNGCFPHFAA